MGVIRSTGLPDLGSDLRLGMTDNLKLRWDACPANPTVKHQHREIFNSRKIGDFGIGWQIAGPGCRTV